MQKIFFIGPESNGRQWPLRWQSECSRICLQYARIVASHFPSAAQKYFSLSKWKKFPRPVTRWCCVRLVHRANSFEQFNRLAECMLLFALASLLLPLCASSRNKICHSNYIQIIFWIFPFIIRAHIHSQHFDGGFICVLCCYSIEAFAFMNVAPKCTGSRMSCGKIKKEKKWHRDTRGLCVKNT